MSTIDHGKWLPYTPPSVPQGMRSDAMYARRESDLRDWYSYVYTVKAFGEQTVKGAARWSEEYSCYIVGPATYDASSIFPANHLVFEVTNYAGSDPFKDFNGKVYHPEDGTFTEFVPPEPPSQKLVSISGLKAQVDALQARVAKLEKSARGG